MLNLSTKSEPFVMKDEQPLAIYIHWPFCVSKCPYCDFNSHVGDISDQQAWRSAYRRELTTYVARLPGRRITSIFFGGGTPSLMEAETVHSVLKDIDNLWSLDKNVEITLEANPSSAEATKFADFRAAGVNRLSLGIQSLNPQSLKFLGRAHNAEEAIRAIALAARTFPRFSFDLIYALKDQTPESWQQELKQALALAGDHLSLYQLTIEPYTQFYTRAKHGEILTAPDDHAALMFEVTQEIMNAAGLPAYEISNHARAGEESRHNITYWHYEDYVGIGPGAHGRLNDKQNWYALENHRAPSTWLKETTQTGRGIKKEETLDRKTAKEEALMMGLRLKEGVNLQDWQKKFSEPLTQTLAPTKVAHLKDNGFLMENDAFIHLSSAGLQRLNAILGYLL